MIDVSKWHDISSEAWREYHFPGSEIIRIEAPLKLFVTRKKEGDSHRIVAKGGPWYIRSGWLAISWQPRKGQPPFVM